jgi:exodeoxyribonuclease V alpha subunit
MAAEVVPSEAAALAVGPAPAAPLELLRSVCGRLLDQVEPLLSAMPLTALDILTLGDLLSLSGLTRDAHLIVVLAGLFGALEEGSVCLKLTPAHLSSFARSGQVPVLTHHLDGFRENLVAGIYAGLVDEAEALGGAPLVHVRGRGGAQRPDLLYFQRLFRHERRLQARLEAFLARGSAPLCPPDRIDPLIEALWRGERVIRLGSERLPLAADPWQQAALRLALMRPFAVISGGPGTGKTSLMVNILRLLTDCGIEAGNIRLTAPTGRAAQRMREALQHFIPGVDVPTDGEKRLLEIEPTTLHRLLRFDPREQGFLFHAGHPLPARVVIVDEVSMIDVGMLDRLLQAVDPVHTRLILLGDKDQLPSVQAGAVFAEMVPTLPAADISETHSSGGRPLHRFHDHLVILQNSYRSGRRLLALGATINAGKMPEMTACTMAEALNLPVDSYACIKPTWASGQESRPESILAAWVDHHYATATDGGSTYLGLAAALSGRPGFELTADGPPAVLGDLFDRLNRARILTVARRGLLGSTFLNRRVVAYLAGRYGQAIDPATGLFDGIPILITRNDYSRRLFNGDVGVALRDATGSLRVYVQRGIRVVSAPIQTLSSWEPAFATTVHKSQGSEFGDVLLVFPGDPDHRLLSREIFYTGVTRARERLLLLAHSREMAAALARRIQRSSGLSWSR